MKNKAILTLIYFASMFSLSVYAQDTRMGTIDAYILIDRNIMMTGAREDQIEWLCTTLVDSILQTGDRVTVWALDGELSQIAQTKLAEGGGKEELKKAIRNISSSKEEPDYSAGLRAAAAAEASRADRTPIAFALLAASMTREDELVLEKEDAQSARLLRFSRVVDHPGWKAITVGLGIEPKARAAAAAFMDAR
ncbi:hypothetical protein MASR2M78_03970 [Treponema sp.]